MGQQKKYFGTDGIRGRVGQFPIRPDFILKLGWAVGHVLSQQTSDKAKVMIGKDTRVSGYMFESALEAGLSAAGVNCELIGPMPTPAVAYLTRTLRAQLGIVISASHNPYYDNGIKFFSSKGFKLSDEMELNIESVVDQDIQMVSPDRLGKAKRLADAVGRYIEYCKSTVKNEINLKRLKIVVDCANGATYHIAPSVLRELGAEVIELAVDPDGLNINAASGATDLAMLKRMVLAEQADLGIAFDGDGDRVMMVDHQGEVVDGDEILLIIAKSAHQKRPQEGIVGTLMSNLGIELACRDLGMEFVRTKVGDRYVMEELKKRGWLFGGENSGHVVCLNKATTGDGIVSALQVLQAMFYSEKSLFELKKGMQKYPQVLINVPISKRCDLAQAEKTQQIVKNVEQRLAAAGRVLLRPSGTEPVIRVMVEGENDSVIKQAAEEIAEVVKTELG